MTRGVSQTTTCVLLCIAAVSSAAAKERVGPDDWLTDMSQVVDTLDYEGTVIRHKNGKPEAIRIVHKVIDGVINEKLVYQEGNGLEIIRFGNEVHCVLPDRKSVLIEKWNNQSTLFSSLPDSDSRFGAQYHTSVVREDRVAGRPAIEVAIRPHDDFRYGHRLWLDKETAFPLQTDLVDNNGELVEQVKFVEITVGQSIPSKSLRSSFNLQNFTWYTEPTRTVAKAVESDWACDDLPPGFRLVSTTNTEFPDTDAPVTHLMYSDGLATVSVFIGDKTNGNIAERSSEGASSSYSTQLDNYQVTAIGEVPDVTVQRIARSMRKH
jgi:sigma-E factor negative regulatory protein RseB